jgi:hypothetical protein
MFRLRLFFVYAAVAGSMSAQPVARFTLKERFGVSHPDQPVEFAYSGGALDRKNTRMLGPAGEEVPYQQLSSGHLLVHTPLPGSRISTVYSPSQINPKNDTVSINLNMLTGAYPATGEVVRFEGSKLPGGVVEGVNYFLKKTSDGAYHLSRRKNLSDTVHITSSGNAVMRKQGWIVDPDDPGHTIYAKSHHYRTGDPIWLTSSGLLPAPLVSDRPYFVIQGSEDTFQLASTLTAAQSSQAIELTTPGTGVFEAIVEWTWTVVSGQGSSAIPSQPVLLKNLGGSYNVTNGLTGVKVVGSEGNQRPFNRAPIQGVQLADGSWVAEGPNYLYESYSQKPVSVVTKYSLKVIESGPLLVRIEADYTLNRPEYTYGSGPGNMIVASDPVADTITLAGNQYSWNGSTSLQFRSNGGTLPCGLSENKLYWPLTRVYDQAANRTTFTLSQVKAGTRPTSHARPLANRTPRKP